jgi:hypothetical protein
VGTKDYIRRFSLSLLGLFIASQLVLANDSDQSTRDPSEYVVVGGGFLKSQPELDATDVVIGKIIPLTSTNSGTLTVGRTATNCGGGFQILSGFDASLFGSYSPATLTGGDAVVTIIDNTNTCASSISTVSISGFLSNPGSSWLTTITCNSVENTGSGGSFSYSAGTSTWVWSRQFGLIGKSIGSTVSCTIVHN